MKTILKPCYVSNDNFNFGERKIDCSLCKKKIVDFRKSSPKEIHKTLDHFTQKGQSVCGVFQTKQITDYILELPITLFRKRHSFAHRFIIGFIFAFGASSCNINKGNQNNKIKEVVITDSVRVNTKNTHNIKNPNTNPQECIVLEIDSLASVEKGKVIIEPHMLGEVVSEE